MGCNPGATFYHLCHLKKHIWSSSDSTSHLKKWSIYFPCCWLAMRIKDNMHKVLCPVPDSYLALNKQYISPRSDPVHTLIHVPFLLFYSHRNIILHSKAGFLQLLCFFIPPAQWIPPTPLLLVSSVMVFRDSRLLSLTISKISINALRFSLPPSNIGLTFLNLH